MAPPAGAAEADGPGRANHEAAAAAAATPLSCSSPSPSSPTTAATSPATPPPRRPTKPLTLLPLVALIFFEVSGGPFGTEDAVAAAGPLLTLAGFLVLPLVWSIPEALVTAEMATTFPENSGYVALVTAAFGPYAGFLEGFFSWLSGVADNSVYPVLLADNLAVAWPALAAAGAAGAVPLARGAFVLGTSLVLTLLSYRGLQVVGKAAAVTTALVVAPFVLLVALALPYADPRQWLECDLPNVRWGTYLNVMFWNLNYWDSVSCLAGEVADPARTFPRALLAAVVLVVAMYFFPTLAALGLPRGMAPPSESWALGDYGRVALAVPGGGKWLAGWVLLAAAASQVGQYQAEMASDAFQLQGMAERGFLPIALARRSRHGTPTWGIALSCLGIALLASSSSFVGIISALNAVYALAELLEFAAFVWLRARAPALPRPYRVPLSTWGVALMLLPASVLLLAILALPVAERDWTTLGVSLGALVVGSALYPFLQLCKARGWMAFADLRFEFEHHVVASSGGRGGGSGRGAAVAAAAQGAEEGADGAARRLAAAAGARAAKGGGLFSGAAAEREPLLPEGRGGDGGEEAVAAEEEGRQGRNNGLLAAAPPPAGPAAPPRARDEGDERPGRRLLPPPPAPAPPDSLRRSGSWSIRAAGDHPRWEGGDEYASRRVDSVDFDGATRTTAAAAASGGGGGRRRPRRPSAAGGGGSSRGSFDSAGASPPPGLGAGSWRQGSGAAADGARSAAAAAAAAAVSSSAALPAHPEEEEQASGREGGDEEQGRARGRR
jgi:amino acid transporter